MAPFRINTTDNLSSRVILPITIIHKCVVIQQCYFYKEIDSYSQKYYKLKG